jgi:hypothetical protein
MAFEVEITSVKKTAISIVTQKAFSTPYTYTPGADGALPYPWKGSTFAITSGVIVNTPTLEGELLTDPGLEATYTGGKCDTLAKNGSPTLAESADVHGGSKAQEFTGAALNNFVYWGLLAGVVGQWYQFSAWGKRTAGTTGDVQGAAIYQANALPVDSRLGIFNSASYAQRKISFISKTTDNIFRYAAKTISSTTYDTVVVDDGSFQKITFSSLMAMLPPATANLTVKAQLNTFVDKTMHGLVVRGSSQTNPTNCIFVLCHDYDFTDSYGVNISVVKKIGSTYTLVLADTLKGFVADAWVEARCTGSTVKIYYNNAQVGADLTISDAELVNNLYHGIFSSGGNSLKAFFVG